MAKIGRFSLTVLTRTSIVFFNFAKNTKYFRFPLVRFTDMNEEMLTEILELGKIHTKIDTVIFNLQPG